MNTLLCLAVAASLALSWLPGPALQEPSGPSAALTTPDFTSFPKMSAYLDVRNASGEFLHGLLPEQINLLEDEQSIPVSELRELKPGVDVIVAINAGEGLAIRNSQGISRYDLISAALRAWSEAQPQSPQKSYSLFTNGEPPLVGIETRSAWREAFDAYQPDLRQAQPALDSLSAALDLAATLPAEAGRDRAILYITPVPEGDAIPALASLSERAVQAKAPVFVWMAASPGMFDGPGSQELVHLAEVTGGQFFPFSGPEVLPDPESYFSPLGSIYFLEYASAIRSGSSHSLVAELTLESQTVSTPARVFELEILPLNPVMLSPPVRITRSSPPDSEAPLEELGPRYFRLEILIEFPDGRVRPLSATRLFIDGELVQENTTPPFEEFNWDLSAYTQAGTHTLRVEAEDQLGITSSSLELPVDVIIDLPEKSVWEELVGNPLAINLAAAGLAGIALAAVLLFATRHKGRSPSPTSRRRRDPLTQVVRAVRKTQLRPTDPSRNRRFGPPGAQAYLMRLDEQNQATSAAPISILGREITFGRDPAQASCVLDSATIDGLHARLRVDGGRYILCDLNSVAGTWVNYAPITREGISLEHNDIVHIGGFAFRFRLANPPPNREPVVQAYNEHP